MPINLIRGDFQIEPGSIYDAQIAPGTITIDKLATPGLPAAALATTGASVLVSLSAPPSTGQVLIATSPTNATWQTPPPPGITRLTGDVLVGPGSGSQVATVVGASGSFSAVGTINTQVALLVNGINVLDTISVSLAGDVITSGGLVIYS